MRERSRGEARIATEPKTDAARSGLRALPRRLAPRVVLAVSLLLTLLVSLVLTLSARSRDRAVFANVVQVTSDRIERRLDAYTALLRATNGLFASQEEVTAQEFARYISLLRIRTEYPGTRGIGFTRRFDRAERFEVERWARTEAGHPDFQAWPEVPGDELHAIVMLEPLDKRNRAAIGYNMHSEPVRREAMDRARDTGQAALSGKVTLKQEIDERKQPGFLIFMPIYRGGGIPETVEARRERLLGFAYSPFRAADLLEGIFGAEREPRAAFQIFDGPAADPGSLLYSSHPMPADPLLTSTATLSVAGRTWTLVFASRPPFEQGASGRLVLPFLVVGLLLSLALFALTRAQVRARGEAELAAQRLGVALGERAAAEERLREADRRKDEFLAMLAHELRNPMAPVLTAVELMRRKLRGTEAAHEREVIERQMNHMRRLVDDLLDVSRITRGKIQLNKEPLDLVGATQRAVETARPFAERRQHRLVVRVPDEALWTDADAVRFEQILTNLLNNAAKYSEPGREIRVGLEREGETAALRVADQGVGIPPEALTQLFEPFMQIGTTLDRAQGGLGLGLALVKRLTEMHGGSVEAASAGVGQGSVFTVRLPLLPSERIPLPAPRPLAASPRARGGRRVLVVDDNVDAAQTLGEVLELDGYEVSVVHDGRTAIERAATLEPEVVFLDIGLPGLDGYQVARAIRRSPEGSRVRLVAITGYGQEDDRIRAREAGFDAHLVKPVDIDAVRAQAAPAADAEAAAAPSAGPL